FLSTAMGLNLNTGDIGSHQEYISSPVGKFFAWLGESILDAAKFLAGSSVNIYSIASTAWALGNDLFHGDATHLIDDLFNAAYGHSVQVVAPSVSITNLVTGTFSGVGSLFDGDFE